MQQMADETNKNPGPVQTTHEPSALECLYLLYLLDNGNILGFIILLTSWLINTQLEFIVVGKNLRFYLA